MRFRNYRNSLAATMISLLASGMGVMGICLIVLVFPEEHEVGVIFAALIFIAAFFGLNKLADNIAVKKQAKLAAEERQNTSTNQ